MSGSSAPRRRHGYHRQRRRGRASALLGGRKNAFPAKRSYQPRITCAWTPAFRANVVWPTSCWRFRRWRRNTSCAAPTCSMQETAICTLDTVRCQQPDELHRCELFGADILETSVAMGGTVTGEHGVGVEKAQQHVRPVHNDKNAQMFALKAAFDPQSLLNPGKGDSHAQPLRRYGKMLVRGGQIAHPICRAFNLLENHAAQIRVDSETVCCCSCGFAQPGAHARLCLHRQMRYLSTPGHRRSSGTCVGLIADVMPMVCAFHAAYWRLSRAVSGCWTWATGLPRVRPADRARLPARLGDSPNANTTARAVQPECC